MKTTRLLLVVATLLISASAGAQEMTANTDFDARAESGRAPPPHADEADNRF